MTALPGPFYLGVDLGKTADYTALVLAEPCGEIRPVYSLTHIERVPLRTRYTDAAQHVKALVAGLRTPVKIHKPDPFGIATETMRRPEMHVVLDYTGVGIAVAEIFLSAGIDCPIVLVTITGGVAVTFDEVGIHVPKADLVSVVQRLLQEERLKMPADDPTSDLLAGELAEFQAVIGRTGHVSYGVAADWRAGAHDDLVLATALAVWWGESKTVVRVW